MCLLIGPTQATIVGGDGPSLTKWFSFRVDKTKDAFFVDYTAEVDAYVRSASLPVIRKSRAGPKVLKPSASPEWAIRHLASLTSSLEVLDLCALKS